MLRPWRGDYSGLGCPIPGLGTVAIPQPVPTVPHNPTSLSLSLHRALVQPPLDALKHAPTEGLVAQGLHPSCAGDHTFKTCLGYRVGSRPMPAAKEENPHVKQCIKVGWKNGSVALVENWGFVPKTHVR